ncbi:MAG TPA: Fic family protein [Mycobacteriales bacterium]|nr:Fic family protein [Mycobacteriales bacterium]
MAKVLRRRWNSDIAGLGIPRRDRRSCDYEAYVPDPLVARTFAFAGEVAADVADAEVAITRLNQEAIALVDTEALARILLRSEAVASSRIEGLEVGARRLLHAEVERRTPDGSSDVSASEVLGNIDAMVYATEAVTVGSDIGVDLLLETHRRLVADTRLEAIGGVVRKEQNWIGGSSYNPCSAAFVPPPPDRVPDLLADLCAFSSGDDLPAVAQAAIAHAQFETIHPFADGNGRTGRALIHLILRRRGLAPRVLPPISLVLATWAKDYVGGLTAYRYLGKPDSEEAIEGLNRWTELFAAACIRAVSDALSFQSRVEELERGWRDRLGTVRANSATDRLLRALPGAPVLTVDGAATLIDRTFNPANEAVKRLADAGILRQITIGRRNRAFEAPEVIRAFTALERQLASPDGDTQRSRPSRPVPARQRSR